MPANKRSNLSRRTRNAASKRKTRANETNKQREARNEVERIRWYRKKQHNFIQDSICRLSHSAPAPEDAKKEAAVPAVVAVEAVSPVAMEKSAPQAVVSKSQPAPAEHTEEKKT